MKRKSLSDVEKEQSHELCLKKTKLDICKELGDNNKTCISRNKEELCKELKLLEDKVIDAKTAKMKSSLIKQGDCITQIAELNTKIKLLREQIGSHELKDMEKQLKFKDTEIKKTENNKYLCDIEKSDLYIDKLEEEAKKYNDGYVKPGLGGGKVDNNNSFNDELNSILSGGIIPKLKTKYSKMINNEYKKIREIRGGGQVGGNPGLILFTSIIKIFLMTVGTFIFDWWPIVVIISGYCAYLEYSMLVVTDTEIVGLEGLSILFAFLCPCCWTGLRLYKGWRTQLNSETDNLWSIMKNCSPYLSMPMTQVKSSACEGTNCYVMSPQCYKSIYETNKEYVGFFGSNNE